MFARFAWWVQRFLDVLFVAKRPSRMKTQRRYHSHQHISGLPVEGLRLSVAIQRQFDLHCLEVFANGWMKLESQFFIFSPIGRKIRKKQFWFTLTMTGMIHNQIFVQNSIFACCIQNEPWFFMFLNAIRYRTPIDSVSFTYQFPKCTSQDYISPHLTYLEDIYEQQS